MDVKEMYEYNGDGQKFLFTIYECNTLKLVLCKKDELVEKENVELYDIGSKGGKRISYGNSSLPFKNYSDGMLDKRWTKIK